MRKDRIAALTEGLEKNKLDALLVMKPESVKYLTSFSADNTALIIGKGKKIVITGFIHAEEASEFFRGWDTRIAKKGIHGEIGRAAAARRIKRLGFEALSLGFIQYKNIKRALKGAADFAAADAVESLREIKERGEILAIKKAAAITARALKEAKRGLGPNATEASVSRHIKRLFIKYGAEGPAFEPIVAAPPASSRPHHIPRAKRLGRRNALLIDIGAKLNGYNSDLTRMCRLGRIKPKFLDIYNITAEAQNRAIAQVRPGVKISDIDRAARGHIEAKGFGRFFGHGTGHGLGLEIHERPYIARNNNARLKEGMVFTIEPGIYIPGLGGVRIEDIVYVEKNGCRVLTDDIDKSI